MESTEIVIARLVLGYLKSQKCKAAYKEFFQSSNFFQEDVNVTKAKYLPTRFVGLTLEDILSDYFVIYRIVQGRLESTNYFNEHHPNKTLVQQLLYLFNSSQLSRTSTPCPRSPLDSNLDETSESHIDHVSDVETTPAHTLPGNIRCASEDSYLHKNSRRKLSAKLDKSTPVENLHKCTEKEDISEVLAQTLLENKEFHQKIAQTINKVAEKQCRGSSQLDKTIKTVVRETEEDPIFDKILDEIIESTNTIDNSKGLESSSTTSSIAKHANDENDMSKSAYYKHATISMDEYVSSCKSYTDSRKVEEQNNEAIRSIIANSKLSSDKQVDNQGVQGNNEVIVFDGTLDNYLRSSTCNANTQTQPVENSLYINTTGGLLMVPSGIATNVTGNIQLEPSKQYYLVNKQPAINWNMPTIKNPNIITEQDILAMPTVIVNDENQNKSMVTQSSAETSSLKPVNVKPHLRTITPKPVIEIPNLQELYGSQESRQIGLKKVIYPVTKKKSNSTELQVNSQISENVPSTTKTNAVDVKNTRSFPDKLLDDPIDPPTKDSGIESHDSLTTKLQKNKAEHQSKTPSSSEPTQKVTPKSGSHVRTLDFSTPPKITSTHKKTMKSKEAGRTSPVVHKKQAVKTLFKEKNTHADKEENIKKSTESKHETRNTKHLNKKITKSLDTWDADLRATIPAVEDNKNEEKKCGTKRKRTPSKDVKKKVKKEHNEEVHQLNTTENDAVLLEAALQSPMKTDSQQTDNITDEIKPKVHDTKEDRTPEGKPKKSVKSKKLKTRVIKNHSEAKTKDNKSKKITDCKRKIKLSPEESTSKMVLSPSKLNASKRNFVNTENLKSTATDNVINLSDDKSKFVTPEMVKETITHPIKANRNITPMLETPLKNAFIPKTPGSHTPLNVAVDLSICSTGFTPFAKMLEENLKGIDINSMPTPSIPITPSFPPFTPTIDLISPYSNRPTDYSTSSSYYQPSDTEPNKSLEVNLIELENKPVKIISEVIIKEQAVVTSESEVIEHVILNDEIIVSENTIGKEVNEFDQDKPAHSTTIKEHLNIFNKNIIGKKNLNLMKRSSSPSSSSSDESTSESSSDGGTHSPWTGEQSNETVIFQKKAADNTQRRYPLRSQTVVTNNSKEDAIKKPVNVNESKTNKNQSDKETKATPKTKTTSKINIKECKETPNLESKEEVKEKEIPIKNNNEKNSVELSSFKQKVLKELEEKRLRTINKFKNVDKTPAKKSSAKTPSRQNKFLKIKPIPNITNSRRKPRKSASPRKSSESKMENDGGALKCNTNNTAKQEANKKAATSPKRRDTNNDSSASDVEAQNLIEGLKERGIHLMHNKSSPTKKLNRTSTESKVENVITENTDSICPKNEVNCNKDDISKSVSPEINKTGANTSQLESEVRETYDTRTYEEYECVVFDESKKITKTFNDYDTKKVLEKTIMGKVFVEEIDTEIDVPLVFSPFFPICDIPLPSDLYITEHGLVLRKPDDGDKVAQHEKTGCKRKSIEKTNIGKYDACFIRDVSNPAISEDIGKSDDDLMNYAIIGSGKEETPERSDSPKSSRKKKPRNEENSHTEKKCKTLLKKINVDSFLNNIHGGS